MFGPAMLPHDEIESQLLDRDFFEGPTGSTAETSRGSDPALQSDDSEWRWRNRSPALVDPTWRDVWSTVTPVWFVLVSSRVLFYGLERLRFPDIVPPVWADAIQGILLWPLVVLGCYLTLRTWQRVGLLRTAGVAVLASLVVGAIARPAYAVASLLGPDTAAAHAWLYSFASAAPGFLYAWLSNVVEYAVLYLSCAAAAVGFMSFRSLMNERLLRMRVEATAARERLRTLRAQLNPHFLFNTLNSIVSLSDAQSSSAQQLVSQLCDLLRRTLLASEREEHELWEEVAHVEAYLRIQQVRQPSRIKWHVSVDALCTAASVPSLILLSLVENAVTHGLRGGAHHVDIEIGAARDRTSLTLRVCNTCREASSGGTAGLSGLGLRNARERLAVLFGTRAALVIQRPRPGRFEVRITLPLHEHFLVSTCSEESRCAS